MNTMYCKHMLTFTGNSQHKFQCSSTNMKECQNRERHLNVHQFGLQYLLISANIIINFQVSGQSTSLRKNDFSRDCVSSAVAQG